jgi:uncharacterized protein (DUF58 family)
MVTRAGTLLLVASGLLALGGRTLGLVELYVLATAGALAVVIAVVRLAVLRPQITVRRTVRPARVHVGAPARVELELVATGRRSTPVLTLVDPVGDRPGARLHLASLAPGRAARAAYRLPTRHRGEIPVGPLAAEVTDPFGLARRSRVVAERVPLIVLPHVDLIAPLHQPAGSEPLSGQEGRPGMGRSGDEFHALRPYVVGDDLRRVHWPMSARTDDDLVVRQDDEPRQGRLTVVLDVNKQRSGAEGFERMVSAAASIASAHWRRGDIVRLLCSDGRDTGWVTGQVAFENLLEVLAVAHRVPTGNVGRVLGRTDAGTDTVVTVVGDLLDAEVAVLPGRRAARTGRRAGLTVVRFVDTRTPRATVARVVEGVRVIDVPPTRAFATTWSDAVAPARRTRTRSRA